MAQDAREDQAQAPDLGASVQLEPSESLEGPLDGDPLDAGYVPPDRPYALDEDPAGDTLDDRLRREQGEEPVDPDRSGRITIAGEGAALETPDAMDGVDVGVDGGAAGAEEAAVHEIDDAVIGTAGAPVETEPSVADVPALDDPELEAALAAGDPQAERAREQAGRDLDGEAGST
ncbi:MAG TPA: DUF5709 domain-containing protein [Pseudonocardia sp.]|nr:DUF5709 domain-containing protein [Pseudonocardia sp.]